MNRALLVALALTGACDYDSELLEQPTAPGAPSAPGEMALPSCGQPGRSVFYDTEPELVRLVLGRWLICEKDEYPAFDNPGDVGVEFLEDGTWQTLQRAEDGALVPNNGFRSAGRWSTCCGRQFNLEYPDNHFRILHFSFTESPAAARAIYMAGDMTFIKVEP